MERYAYLYPFSRDVALYESLVDQVYRYRMVIGQPDQEELLRHLHERLEDGTLDGDDLAGLYVNLCPYVWRREGGERAKVSLAQGDYYSCIRKRAAFVD